MRWTALLFWLFLHWSRFWLLYPKRFRYCKGAQCRCAYNTQTAVLSLGAQWALARQWSYKCPTRSKEAPVCWAVPRKGVPSFSWPNLRPWLVIFLKLIQSRVRWLKQYESMDIRDAQRTLSGIGFGYYLGFDFLVIFYRFFQLLKLALSLHSYALQLSLHLRLLLRTYFHFQGQNGGFLGWNYLAMFMQVFLEIC